MWADEVIQKLESDLGLVCSEFSKMMIHVISAAPSEHRELLGVLSSVATRPYLGPERFENAIQLIGKGGGVPSQGHQLGGL